MNGKYRHFLFIRAEIRTLSGERGSGRRLVLVRGDSHPDYMSGWIYNPLDWNSDGPVYAWDRRDEVRARVLAAYPDRRVWVVDGPTRTGTGFRVVGAPGAAK